MSGVPPSVQGAARRWLHRYVEEEQRWTLAFAVLALVAIPVVVVLCWFGLACVIWVCGTSRHSHRSLLSFHGAMGLSAVALAICLVGFARKSDRERDRDLQGSEGCFNSLLYLPGHVIFGAWRQWRRLVGLGFIDREGCAAVIALSFVHDTKMHVGEIQRALPDVDAYAVLAELRLIPDVRFSSSEPDTIYLGATLRQALQAGGA